jgi:PBP1b-binding outer membrane lipoprotein LpoB
LDFDATRRNRAAAGVALAFVLAGCSKSPVDSAIDAANTLATRLMAPLMQKDASMQARKLIDKIENRPECEVYKQRLREAGKASPYAATTQRALVVAYRDAHKAGCEKPDCASFPWGVRWL